jgi:AraC-like DNA-binding protein
VGEPVVIDSTSQPDFFSQQVREAQRFYLDLAPSTSTPLVVVSGGVEQCAPEYEIRRSTFPYQSIEYVARGTGWLNLDGREVALRPGVAFTYGPGIAQHITTDAKDLLTKYFVDFAGKRSRRLLEDLGMEPGAIVRVSNPGEIQDAFDRLVRDGQSNSGLGPTLAITALEYLLLKTADTSSPLDVYHTPAYESYQRCRQHVLANFERLQSLAQIARECFVDRAYLCRLFRRFDHQTPHQFLMRLKMNAAAERLHETDLLVRQIAAEFGFDDPFHFSRVFKKAFGVSPHAFRKLR